MSFDDSKLTHNERLSLKQTRVVRMFLETRVARAIDERGEPSYLDLALLASTRLRIAMLTKRSREYVRDLMEECELNEEGALACELSGEDIYDVE